MSRKCKLRSKRYGELGQWAYERITELEEQLKQRATDSNKEE